MHPQNQTVNCVLPRRHCMLPSAPTCLAPAASWVSPLSQLFSASPRPAARRCSRQRQQGPYPCCARGQESPGHRSSAAPHRSGGHGQWTSAPSELCRSARGRPPSRTVSWPATTHSSSRSDSYMRSGRQHCQRWAKNSSQRFLDQDVHARVEHQVHIAEATVEELLLLRRPRALCKAAVVIEDVFELLAMLRIQESDKLLELLVLGIWAIRLLPAM
eukprot:356419-Prymnesium_polylepis.1